MHINEHTRRMPTVALTPLIDVVFILLVFFMLSTRFGLWQDLPVHVTSPTSTPVQAEDDQRLIRIQSDGHVQLDGETLSLEQLAQALQASPERTTRVSGADDAPIQAILRVVDILNEAGVDDARLELMR